MPPSPQQTVLLEHSTPDGDSHFDWLLERDEVQPLVCFRVHERLDISEPAAFLADRIADHRRLYLRFEGSLSAGRGSVRRIAAGACFVRLDAPGEFIVDIAWPGGPWQRLHGQPQFEHTWTFVSQRLGAGNVTHFLPTA
ncbi:MAG: hypothetical protein JSR77_08575 [Planctomycetes bacterium]|nr:hypothetical protein [Planctomycetota bacterium]